MSPTGICRASAIRKGAYVASVTLLSAALVSWGSSGVNGAELHDSSTSVLHISSADSARISSNVIPAGTVGEQSTSEIPGELLGSWLTEDESAGVEFESDGTYTFVEVSNGYYIEAGSFEVNGRNILYTPEKVTMQKDDGPTEAPAAPDPYTETWRIEDGADGTAVLTVEGEDGALSYQEVDLSTLISY